MITPGLLRLWECVFQLDAKTSCFDVNVKIEAEEADHSLQRDLRFGALRWMLARKIVLEDNLLCSVSVAKKYRDETQFSMTVLAAPRFADALDQTIAERVQQCASVIGIAMEETCAVLVKKIDDGGVKENPRIFEQTLQFWLQCYLSSCGWYKLGRYFFKGSAFCSQTGINSKRSRVGVVVDVNTVRSIDGSSKSICSKFMGVLRLKTEFILPLHGADVAKGAEISVLPSLSNAVISSLCHVQDLAEALPSSKRRRKKAKRAASSQTGADLCNAMQMFWSAKYGYQLNLSKDTIFVEVKLNGDPSKKLTYPMGCIASTGGALTNLRRRDKTSRALLETRTEEVFQLLSLWPKKKPILLSATEVPQTLVLGAASMMRLDGFVPAASLAPAGLRQAGKHVAK